MSELQQLSKQQPNTLLATDTHEHLGTEVVQDNLSVFINNIILFCKLSTSKRLDSQSSKQVRELLKAQLNELWFEEHLKLLIDQLGVSIQPSQQQPFESKLYQLEQLIRTVGEQKNNASSQQKYVAFQNEVNQYIQQLEGLLSADDVQAAVQSFDLYGSAKVVSEGNSKQTSEIDIPSGHCFRELINTKINYGPNVFNFVRPGNHQLYITEAAKTYHDIAPFKLKNISLSLTDGPVINRTNYFDPDLDESKAIIGICIGGTNKYGFYSLFDICKVHTFGKQFYHQRTLSNDWTFSSFTKSVITPSGKIYALNCRSTKEKADPYLYQITQSKASNRGPIPAAKRDSALVYLNGYLYALGGQGQGQKCSRKGYRYSLREKKWTQISESNVAVRKATVCAVSNRYLLKLGGLNEFDYINKIIEMYDSLSDRWSLVRASPRNIMQEIQILEDAQAVQISDDQVYIFGGKNANNIDSGFVLLISEIREKKKGAAKVSGEFWNVSVGKRNILTFFGDFTASSVLVQHNCIYGLRTAVTTALTI